MEIKKQDADLIFFIRNLLETYIPERNGYKLFKLDSLQNLLLNDFSNAIKYNLLDVAILSFYKDDYNNILIDENNIKEYACNFTEVLLEVDLIDMYKKSNEEFNIDILNLSEYLIGEIDFLDVFIRSPKPLYNMGISYKYNKENIKIFLKEYFIKWKNGKLENSSNNYILPEIQINNLVVTIHEQLKKYNKSNITIKYNPEITIDVLYYFEDKGYIEILDNKPNEINIKILDKFLIENIAISDKVKEQKIGVKNIKFIGTELIINNGNIIINLSENESKVMHELHKIKTIYKNKDEMNEVGDEISISNFKKIIQSPSEGATEKIIKGIRKKIKDHKLNIEIPIKNKSVKYNIFKS
ncbi:MAG: hypothetical protein GY828_05115 [Candidatus Gracilibacteria bacterium]|nr:hypothetical protein [Candidatus Gracilibacteria bacterium]